MLRLKISSESERLRAQFTAWIKDHTPPEVKSTELSEFIAVGRAWQRELASGGWLGSSWPVSFGGKGLGLAEDAIIQEELVRVGSPQILGLFGLSMVGPVLIQHGTENQKERFLRKILSGDEIWCQGFSEPGAGSDLAAVKTKAVRSEGGYIVSGQKIWTSFAHIADWCFLLARTDSNSTRHRGLSYLLVDMRSSGISTRPLTQISGDSEFNEVFFDDVFVPEENIVGGEGDGWKIAISTLMFERVVLTFARQLQSEQALSELLARYKNVKSKGFGTDNLAERVAEACAVRALAYEHLLTYSSGSPPGPEGSLDKLLWSESFQRLTKSALRELCEEGALSELTNSWIHRYLYSRGRTIAAGTSEIQRTIIAERLLHLPRIR